MFKVKWANHNPVSGVYIIYNNIQSTNVHNIYWKNIRFIVWIQAFCYGFFFTNIETAVIFHKVVRF